MLLHLQNDAAHNMEGLTKLTVVIGIMAQREAIAMRIITIVTLIFLPATFVSVSLEELQIMCPVLAN
jgi:Mg2+ and Co2+ transporter CorA